MSEFRKAFLAYSEAYISIIAFSGEIMPKYTEMLLYHYDWGNTATTLQNY
jgi:hypothetical protein